MTARRTLLALMLVSAGCTRHNETQSAAGAGTEPRAIPITVAAVTIRPSERLVSFVGTLYGHDEVTLSSQMEGQIKSIAADLGDHIEANQVLAEIEDDQLRARLREVEATWGKARADETRGRQLVEQKVISPQEYESMKTTVSVIEAQRDTLSVLLQHTQVRSPLTGLVAKRLVSAGEYVRPGTPLFALVADDPLKLRGDVPERFADELQVGQTVRVRVDAFPDAAFDGKLSRISPSSNRENRSIAVEALVDNHDRKLKAGFFANAAIVTRSDEEAVMVPQEALITFAGVTKLFVVADSIAHERQVRPGARTAEGMIEIVEGLRADETVATSGLTKLQNGASVAVKKPGEKQG
jgi:membrane fusion protein (multidrug efflux system)